MYLSDFIRNAKYFMLSSNEYCQKNWSGKINI